MFSFLAQTAPETAPASQAATAPAAVFDWALWAPSSHELGRSVLVLAGALVAGIVLMFFLRDLLSRVRLSVPMVVAIFACSIYAAFWGLKPARMWAPADPVAFWVHRLFAAAVVFVLLRVLDRLALVPMLTRRGTVSMPRFFHQIVNIVLALFAILIFGSVAFGWDIDKFLAGSAVVSIVLGLALQESLGNFFSGLVMQASPPFAIGDWIVCGDHEGRVVDMTWRAVTLQTDDENYIIIPNATIARADIVNYSAPTRATQRPITVGLDYDLPPMDAIEVLKAAALETAGVLASPPPVVFITQFADSAIVYQLEFSILEAHEHRKIETDVRINVWYRLKQKGYNIPFPIRTVEHVSLAHKARKAAAAATERYLHAIETVPLLAPLSQPQKLQLASTAADLLLAPGQFLFRQNDPGDSFYIISQGQVEVLVTPEGSKEERKVATLGKGDFFGEMSALTGQPRTASIKAATPLVLVQVEKRDLLPIFQQDPALMERISEVVVRRNAEREAVMQGAGATPAPETVVRQQKSLLGRMMRFFRLGNAA